LGRRKREGGKRNRKGGSKLTDYHVAVPKKPLECREGNIQVLEGKGLKEKKGITSDLQKRRGRHK